MKKDDDGFNARAEELLERYAGLVYRLAFARTRSREGAEDVFRRCFSAWWPSGHNWKTRNTRKPGSAG